MASMSLPAREPQSLTIVGELITVTVTSDGTVTCVR